MKAAPANTYSPEELAADTRRLKDLCRGIAVTRDEHKRQRTEIATLAIKWKERLPYGQYQATMRDCGFNLKTLEKWVLEYRRSVGEAPPRRPRMETTSPSRPGEGRLQPLDEIEAAMAATLGRGRVAAAVTSVDAEVDDAGHGFDLDGELDEFEDEALAGLEDDEKEEGLYGDDGAESLAVAPVVRGEHGGGGEQPRLAAAPAAGPRPRGENAATQLTFDEIYRAAEGEARELVALIHARQIPQEEVAKFRAWWAALQAKHNDGERGGG